MPSEKTALTTKDKIFILRNSEYKTAEDLAASLRVPLEWVKIYVRDAQLKIKPSVFKK